jgi:hypothetical protein
MTLQANIHLGQMWASMQLNITWTTKAKLFSFYEAPATEKIRRNTENWTPTSSQLQELAVRSHTRMLPFWSPDISSVWNWTHSSAHSLQVNPSSMDCICAHFIYQLPPSKIRLLTIDSYLLFYWHGCRDKLHNSMKGNHTNFVSYLPKPNQTQSEWVQS